MYERRWMLGFGPGITPIVRILLLINVAVYFLQLLSTKVPVLASGLFLLTLQPARLLSQFTVWQVVTYMFLHGNFFHILFNMFTLWMFGCEVERYLGSSRFLRFYIISGIGAAIFHILFNYSSSTPVIGASGAIYGILVAFAVLFPERVVTLLLFFVFPIQIKAKYLVGIFLLISIVSGIESEVFGVSDGVAHLAHLGGALTGYFLLRGNKTFDSWLLEFRKKLEWHRVAAKKQKQAKKQEKQQEIDRILDRINKIGYDNITNQEKIKLKKASKYISKN